MNSQRKKVNAISLYLKDLKRQDLGNVYDYRIAQIKFKSLPVKDRDYYEVKAKKMNDKSEPLVYKNQRDTLGRNIKEMNDMDRRRSLWELNAKNIIKNISEDDDVMDHIFYVAKVSGAEYNKPSECENCFVSSEIILIKFTFSQGIIDEMVLFPDVLKVPSGYRQSLYEDLEESVGWKPDTFRSNHAIAECVESIRTFFEGKTDQPIFVPTKEHQVVVGMGLYHLYKELGFRCPWIESFQDWGQNTRIYQLEYLVSNIMKAFCKDDPEAQKDMGISLILDYWLRIMMDYSPECCERHINHGLPNQCATNLLKKYLYISFVVMNSVCSSQMLEINEMISSQFYKNLDFILPSELQADGDVRHYDSDHWHETSWNEYYENSGIEDVINSLGGITLSGRGIASMNNHAGYVGGSARRIELGRGRGMLKSSVQAKNELPGRKIKLPRVIC